MQTMLETLIFNEECAVVYFEKFNQIKPFFVCLYIQEDGSSSEKIAMRA